MAQIICETISFSNGRSFVIDSLWFGNFTYSIRLKSFSECARGNGQSVQSAVQTPRGEGYVQANKPKYSHLRDSLTRKVGVPKVTFSLRISSGLKRKHPIPRHCSAGGVAIMVLFIP
jgi:hypothetical protein